MAIAVQCPSCDSTFWVPDDYAGKRGKCPKCGTVFRASLVDQPDQHPSTKEARQMPASTIPRPARWSQAPLVVATVVLIVVLIGSTVTLIALNPLGKRGDGKVTEIRRARPHRQTVVADKDLSDRKIDLSSNAGSISSTGETVLGDNGAQRLHASELRPSSSDELVASDRVTLDLTPQQEKVMTATVQRQRERPDPGSLESVDWMNTLHQQCKAQGWAPATSEEYETYQQLAEYVAASQLQVDDERVQEGLRVIVNAAAEQVLSDLSQTPWPDDARVSAVNQQAVEGLGRSGAGLFAYVEVTIPSREIQPIDDLPIVVFQLLGTEQLIALQVRENPPDLRKGTRWLLLGINDPFVEIVIPSLNADGKDRVATFVRAKSLVGKPEPVTEVFEK